MAGSKTLDWTKLPIWGEDEMTAEGVQIIPDLTWYAHPSKTRTELWGMAIVQVEGGHRIGRYLRDIQFGYGG